MIYNVQLEQKRNRIDFDERDVKFSVRLLKDDLCCLYVMIKPLIQLDFMLYS